MLSRFVLFITAFVIAYFSALSPVWAFDLPPTTTDLRRIEIRCNREPSDITYYFQGSPNQTFEDSDTAEDYCDELYRIVSEFEGSAGVPEETLQWWQATIDFLNFTERIGAIFYPAIFGMKVIHLIAHS